MADSRLSALSAAGAFADADLLYIVQSGTSYKTTWGAIKAAILLAKYPEVANFAALPAAGDHDTETYVCLASQGVYFVNRKPAGFYYSDGANWNHVGDLPEDYFTDSILQISDDADPTKICKFQLSSITAGNTRTLTVPDASGTIMLVGNAPATHATSHKSGGGDAIKLDELAAPTDVTTLDASTSAHGLVVKATAPASGLINVVAIGNGETAYTNKALLDSTNPAALGSVGPGTATVAARRDHVHAMPSAADVGALPIAGGTMTGDIVLGENTAIELDAAGSADEKWSGITIDGTAGATLAVGDLCYLDVTAAEWLLTDADTAATAGPVVLGLCVLAANDGQATRMLLHGTMRSAAFPASIALGAPVYVGLTAGDIAASETWGTDDVIRIVGYAITVEPNTIYFNPSTDYITYV